jgi:hypothetical protein
MPHLNIPAGNSQKHIGCTDNVLRRVRVQLDAESFGGRLHVVLPAENDIDRHPAILGQLQHVIQRHDKSRNIVYFNVDDTSS